MSKHFFNSAPKVGGTRRFKHLSAILKPREFSQLLPTKTSNSVLKQVVGDWDYCQKSRRAYDGDLPRFSFFSSIPQYKHKIWGSQLLTQNNQSIEKRGGEKNNGLLHLSQNDIIISTKSQNVIQARRRFATALYFVEAANQKPVRLVDVNYHLRTGIDLGIDRLVALASNKPTFPPTIYDKKHLKSINQRFNQRRAFLLSKKLDKGKYTTRQIQQITFNRNKRLENYLHQTSSLIVKRLVDEKKIQLIIGTDVRGKPHLKSQKQHPTFVEIPHTQLVNFITPKAELLGIKVIVTQASYTNKCRFLDLEPVGKKESYQGKKGKREGCLYFHESGINADVNAALNMLTKVNVNSPLEECHNRIYMFAISPVRVDPVRKEQQKVW
ncbi:transposase [Microcoleus vaginatus]|uniref:transposase n=1 Tax=Microcoleus vaginatus TaxID=119532 RepID=UPI001F608D04